MMSPQLSQHASSINVVNAVAFPAMAVAVLDLARRVKWRLERHANSAVRRVRVAALERAKVDPRITYPSYMSLDDFIDVGRLKSLDEFMTAAITRHLTSQEDELFYTGDLTIEKKSPKLHGSRIIFLSKVKPPSQYMDLDNPDRWERAKEADEFGPLMDFIASLPFKTKARMMIMYDTSGKAVTAHRDHMVTKVCHEFVWFRTNLSKPFYMLNPKTGERGYVQSYAAWFDSVNQFHGADAKPGLSFSIRVDGTFTDEFRKRIPVPAVNRASTPSLWASLSAKS